MFIRGIAIGLNLWIPKHGHFCPIKISGDKDVWKKAQKNETKKKTSDVINKSIPSFNPLITSLVWRFSNVDSRIMSRHHLHAMEIIKNKLKYKKKFLEEMLLNVFAVVKTVLNNWKDAKIGQGLGDTRWNGTKIFLVIYKL